MNFEFVLDFGTIINIFMSIFYLVTIIIFMSCKIGPFGLKKSICLTSEEIWHKVHVAAGIGTIPFLLISIIAIFLKSFWLKIIIVILLIFMLLFVWDLIVKAVTKEDVKKLKQKEDAELKEQIKKETGWR